jgi:hypothetical protein
MLLFRDEEHVDRWCGARTLPRGATLSPGQGWRLAQAWYGDRLSATWRRFTVEEAEGILAGVGLVGDFWRLW